jgi:hypothetical protein
MAGEVSFLQDAEEVRGEVEPGAVNWEGSPFVWMLSNGPVTKNSIGRSLARRWLQRRNPESEIEDGPGGTFGYHFQVNGKKIRVHFGMQGKEGQLRFSSLMEPGAGADYMLCLGVEPRRIRWWIIRPSDTVELPGFKGDDSRMHSLAFDPDDPPAWLEARLAEEETY